MIIHPLLIKKNANLQIKTVNPATTPQTYTPDTGKDGFSQFTVNPVNNTIDSNIQAGYIKKDITILGITGTFEGSASDQPTLGKAAIIVNATNSGGTAISGATVTITDTTDSSITFSGTTDTNGRFYKEVNEGTYSVSISEVSNYLIPAAQEIEASVNEANYVYMVYQSASVVYGVKIDLANSNPETSVTYTDDAASFSKSYMDFANDVFVDNGWENRFPFNQIKPCLFKDGAVVKYLNPNNYAKDTDGNDVIITGADGDVMIEIPKIYYRLVKDASYQYIQISDQPQTGFCCLAHTYKGVVKNKVYIGAYQSYYDGTKARSVSGVSATGSVSLNTWRTYSQAQGTGYENFYWNLLVLLQALFTIRFKNLDSQTALGYGWCNSGSYSTGGGLNDKGMNYCASGTANAQMKFIGIEDFWGSRRTWVDGAYISGSNLTIADATSASMAFSGTGVGYITAASGLTTGSGYFTNIVGDNNSGFCPQGFSGSASTYYCDYDYVCSSSVPYFGGSRSNAAYAGVFYVYFSYTASYTAANSGGRLAFCG